MLDISLTDVAIYTDGANENIKYFNIQYCIV